ncbi:MAG: O-antigen ligase family protein, partial [Bacteroidales bacterium]|nr:O-antigen ligase family protein [Bacteroidales bacterium]
MKVIFKHTLTIFQVLLIASMLSTSFMATQGFFNDLVTSKQYGLEIISLLAGVLFVIVLLFQREVIVTKTDLLVILFAAWFVISELIASGNFTSISLILFELFLWGLVYMIVRQFSGNSVFVWGIIIVWLAVIFLQSGLGLMQLYGLERSYHGLFRITGTFHNPGPFSGFVVSALPLALGVICFIDVRREVMDSNRDIYLKWLNVDIPFFFIFRYLILTLAWITLVSILLVLPPAQSRAAWIAGIAGCLYVLTGHPALLAFKENLIKKFLSFRKPLRVLLIIVIMLPLLTGGFGLYGMKKGSADGRLLMWQVTSQLIKKNPVTGHGTGAFKSLYMDEQAN